jgi:hypothetical protein
VDVAEDDFEVVADVSVDFVMDEDGDFVRVVGVGVDAAFWVTGADAKDVE